MICSLSGRRPEYSSSTASRTKYSNTPGASVVGFGGGEGGKGAKKLLGVRLRSRDAFGMPQQFASNPMLSFFDMDFALKVEGEDQKNKGLHRKILGYLITFTRSVFCFNKKKAFVVTCFWAKVYWSSWEAQGVIWGRGTAQKNPSPCIGVARIFEWGIAKPKLTCNDVIRNF